MTTKITQNFPRYNKEIKTWYKLGIRYKTLKKNVFSTPQQSFFQKDFLNLQWPAELAKQYLEKR